MRVIIVAEHLGSDHQSLPWPIWIRLQSAWIEQETEFIKLQLKEEQTLRTHRHNPLLLLLLRLSQCRPPRSPSPTQRDLHEPRRTLPLPFPRQHTNGRRHAWNT